MIIYNFTQHQLTEEQKKDGIGELPAEQAAQVRELLNFESKPGSREVQVRAEQLAEVAAAAGAGGVMLGGAPFLMPPLAASLQRRGIRTFFAFSQRRSTEVLTADSRVEKRCIFCYEGLIEL